MTKTQEIAILHEAIKKLGNNSYCGPWLASVADEVLSEIRSDFMPSPTMWLTKKACEDLVATTKRECAELTATALKTADNYRAAARRDMDAAIVRAIEALNAARVR